MRFRLRTLLIVTAVLPPVLAAFWPLLPSSLGLPVVWLALAFMLAVYLPLLLWIAASRPDAGASPTHDEPERAKLNESASIRVWGRPSLGGWLSLLNIMTWLALLTLLRCTADAGGMNREEWWTAPVMFTMVFMSLPLASCLLGPGGGGRGDPLSEAVTMAIVLGLNAFAWGYGLALIVGGVRKWIAVLRPPVRARGESAKASG
ncbi:MAG TPA: hypothetical protein VFV87_22015 [Pirellulaceae bacterium]|nr:hypothetical protein [Pirellulaceae bacterium]